MRELTSHKVNGCNDGIGIFVLDEPGSGGANHHYVVRGPLIDREPFGNSPDFAQEIKFQNGPLKESGINGSTHEALLAILEDRLVGFQSGKFACDANAEALLHVRAAQTVLKKRTEERLARGVEGTHTK